MTIIKRFIIVAAITSLSLGAGTADAARKPKQPPPSGPVVLVDQMGGMETRGFDPLSQHKPDDSEIQSAADDFTVPARRTWTLTKVEVGGSRITQSSSSDLLNETPSFNVSVLKADGPAGAPNSVVASVRRVTPTRFSCCQDTNTDGQILPLPDIVLPSGQYWISVAYVHDPLLDNGTWYWKGYMSSNGAVAHYHSPTSGGWQSLVHPHDLELRLTGTTS